ncbi:hypothetical protein LBMAG21_00740 [Armatimonadota bacterium]|nr:hypothetical protein LBMAG21_00740 [Armatimonadota bacterium]
MPLTINLSPEQEAELKTLAKYKRVAPAELAQRWVQSLLHHSEFATQARVLIEISIPSSVLENLTPNAPEDDNSSDIKALAKAEAFRAWAESHRQDAPLLTNEAISRENIYGERG